MTDPARSLSDSKTRRSHSARREDAEERMLQAAVRIVADRGLENLTLAECGEAAGYSRGLAAHYFDSKEGLTSAIASHIVDDYSQRQRTDRRDRIGMPGLLESVEFYIESGRSNLVTLRAFHAVLGSALKQAPFSGAIAELNRHSIDSFAQMIQSGIDRGEIRQDVDPDAQSALLLSALRGVMTLWLLDPEHLDIETIKKEFIGSLKRTLSA